MSIEVNAITKTYGAVLALDAISFSVNEGEIFGLIGPDGAGKTTLFRILTTLLIPNSGSATVGGMDVITDFKAIRNSVGYMPGKFSLYQDLTVEENLKFFATIFGTTIEENYHLIQDIYVQLEPFKNRRAGALSGGMKQKLALCCALVHKPKLLFLDEPTTGVDPVSRKEFWDMLSRLKNSGITMLVSTPYMDEASRCDRIGLIMKGKILSVDTPEQMVNKFPRKVWEVKGENSYALLNDLKQLNAIHSVFGFGDAVHVMHKDPSFETKQLADFLADKKHKAELNLIRPTIEDVFMDLAHEN